MATLVIFPCRFEAVLGAEDRRRAGQTQPDEGSEGQRSFKCFYNKKQLRLIMQAGCKAITKLSLKNSLDAFRTLELGWSATPNTHGKSIVFRRMCVVDMHMHGTWKGRREDFMKWLSCRRNKIG